MFDRNLRKHFVPRENKDYYYSHNVRVKKGSKLDKAIKQYEKKGYYVTDLSGEFKKDPPTLRPALTGGTFHIKHHTHPLAPRDSMEHEFLRRYS